MSCAERFGGGRPPRKRGGRTATAASTVACAITSTVASGTRATCTNALAVRQQLRALGVLKLQQPVLVDVHPRRRGQQRVHIRSPRVGSLLNLHLHAASARRELRLHVCLAALRSLPVHELPSLSPPLFSLRSYLE